MQVQLLWRGGEAFVDALKLVAAAEAAADVLRAAGEDIGPFVWRQPLMRPAASAEQALLNRFIHLKYIGSRAQG